MPNFHFESSIQIATVSRLSKNLKSVSGKIELLNETGKAFNLLIYLGIENPIYTLGKTTSIKSFLNILVFVNYLLIINYFIMYFRIMYISLGKLKFVYKTR